MRLGFVALCLVASQLLPGNQGIVKAGVEEPTIGYALHFFSDVDGIDVYSQYGNFGMIFMRNATLNIEWGHDIVVFPAIDAAPGTQEAVGTNDTAPSATDERMELTIALTDGNFAVVDTVLFTLFRDGVDAGDTLAAAVQLVDLLFEYSD